MKEYMNYHKHDDISSIQGMPDSATKAEEYIIKTVEYGHSGYFTTNHGNCGDIFNSYSLCQKYGIDCYVGLEGYIVPDVRWIDPDTGRKDDRNYHIIVIPKTNEARKKLNVITSHSNMYWFYRRPRLDLQELLQCDKDDFFITTACEAGLLKDEDSVNRILSPLYEHFGDNVMLEVQNHDTDNTRKMVMNALRLKQALNMKIIAANDSHAVDAKGLERRRQLLLGKHISYGDEDTYILDYPDYDTMFERFRKQGILPDSFIQEAIDQTMIFKECEPLHLDYDIKMPSIYPGYAPNQRFDELKKLVCEKFKDVIKVDELTKEELPKYMNAIKYEMQIIKDTNEVCHTADYFLLNTKLVDLATNKYGGVLTRTGRGSCGSFYVNRVLGMTQLDRFKMNLPAFPERFMSTARLIDNRALPDIDMNVVTQEPFVKAARELLGENGCYPMIAYGTLKESEAFRNVCRSYGMDFSEFNDVGKNLDLFRDDPKWKKYIDEAQEYIGVSISSSVHPCAHVLSDKNILEEYGVIKCGDFLCVMVTSAEADEYKLLKDDFLVVSVWDIINEACKMANIPIPTFHDLLKYIDNNPKVWKLVEDGITATVNQMDTDNGKNQAKHYKVSSFEEAAGLSAAIRPSFDSWRTQFLDRIPYSTGSEKLDKVLECTGHYILYQENLMQYFEWLGITPAESIGLIKKISKKKIHPEDFQKLEVRLREGWIKQNGTEDMFDETWQMIQSCMAYGYCSMHGAAVGGDACYSLYLKAYYPMEYYTVILNKYEDKPEKTAKIIKELDYFGINLEDIKFGKSKAQFTFDKETKTIYRSVASIKYCNSQIAEELYNLSQENTYSNFIDLLIDINSKTSVNSRQLQILTVLNYFSDFGKNKKLLNIIDLFDKLYSRKQLKKSDIETLGIDMDAFEGCYEKETEKMYKDLHMDKYVQRISESLENKSLSIKEQIEKEQEYLEYINYKNPKAPDNMYYVVECKFFKDKTKPSLLLYNLKTGEQLKTRITSSKSFIENPFKEKNVLHIKEFSDRQKTKKINGEWVKTDEIEKIVKKWDVY